MTTCQGFHNAACGASSRPGLGARLRERFATWSARALHRRELREVLDMPEHLLRDMGVTREEVYREYRKPFWRA